MKAVLEFNFPDDRQDFELTVNAAKWYSTLWELDQYLRSRLKYEESISDDAYEALDDTRSKLHELMREKSISFD